LGIKRLVIKGDSQLVVNFSNKSYTPKDEHMAAYLEEHRKMEKMLPRLGAEAHLKRRKYGSRRDRQTRLSSPGTTCRCLR
jgi:hypothetical protein